jgi:hypothetical protein
MENDENESIRPPDKIKKEKLIDNIFDENMNDDDLKKVLQLSINEYNFVQEIEEQKAIETISMEHKKRLKQFSTIKPKINRILLFDKTNASIYETILSIIEMYENEYITTYKADKDSYNNIFGTIKYIRITKEELNSLQNLIILE